MVRHKLIDGLLIKGRLIDGAGNILTGTVRAHIPGRGSKGKLFRVGTDGKYKIPIVCYRPNKKIRLIASSPGFLDLEVVIHPKSWINRKGMFAYGALDGGYKVIDYGDLVMIPAIPKVVWFLESEYMIP